MTNLEEQKIQEKQIINLLIWKLLPFLAIIYVVAYIDRTVVSFAKLHMNADIGISESAYGIGAGLFFIGYFLFEVPSNLALEKFGARRWFARILFTWGGITMAMALMKNVNHFYIARFLLGVAEAGLYPGIIYFLTKWFPMRYRARIIGLLVLAQPMALIITSPLAGWILSTGGYFGMSAWQTLFVISGLPAVLLCIPTLYILPESPSHAKWLNESERFWIENQLQADLKNYEIKVSHNPLKALFDKRVLLLSLLLLPCPISVYGLSFWLPTIVKEFGVNDLTTGFLAAVPYLFSIIGLIVLPWSSDYFKEKYFHIAGISLFGAITIALSAWFSTPIWQFIFICLAGFVIYSAQTIIWTLPSQFLTGATAAVGIAVINSIANLGGYIGPAIIGYIKDKTGSTANGLYFLSVSLLFAVLMTFIVKNSLDKNKINKLMI